MDDKSIEDVLNRSGRHWRTINERQAPSVNRELLQMTRPASTLVSLMQGLAAAVLIALVAGVLLLTWANRPTDVATTSSATPSTSPSAFQSVAGLPAPSSLEAPSPSVEPDATATATVSPTMPVRATPTPGPDEDLRATAQDVLRRWDEFMAGAPSDTILVSHELTTQDHGWSGSDGNNAKSALYAGMLDAVVDVPADTPPSATIQWPDGSSSAADLISAQAALDALRTENTSPCRECTPVHVVGVRLTKRLFDTTRGPTELPSWEFTLREGDVHVYRVAAAHAVVHSSDEPSELDAVSLTPSGNELEVHFTRGVCVDPAAYGAVAVESERAVVVFLTYHPTATARPTGASGGCISLGVSDSVTVKLSMPLGMRTVLDISGTPIALDATWLNPPGGN